ncbi:MAG: PFL family protein [Oscillospiraceae bacterium]
MLNINPNDILETIKMIQDEHLDIRTITMGISLLDCIDSDIDVDCKKVYNKITSCAKDLVKVGEDIEKEYGIPIINKRISVTPIAIICAATTGDPVKFAQTMEKAAIAVGVNLIGGYSALVQKGFSAGDRRLIDSIPRALASTEHVCSSVNIGSTKSGINLDACKLMGKIVKECAELTVDNNCFGAGKLVVFCNAPEDNPFMAGAFHGVGEPDCIINVGVSGPGVVRAAIAKADDKADITAIADIIKKIAFKITRMGQLVGTQASKRLGVPFGIVDLSLAPTPAVGDSVAHILEEIGLERCGAHGTTATLALLNDAVKKGGVMASSRIGGLSGAFIPVSEDAGMIESARCGAITIEKLEAMTAVCSVGLDMIVVPGDITPEIIAAIIADEAAIGMVNCKTTAVRIIPAIGKTVGDELNFGGLFGSGPVMKINYNSPAKFINRGGQIPAPLHSLKN